LFRTSQLTQGDVIKTSGPALFDVYNVSPIPGQTGWAGTISTNGGINASKMYKTKLAIAQNILATGLPVDLATKTFTLDTNWVGLPYIANRNLTINEALAYLDAQDGDLLKSQSQFAIYDRVSKSWKGSLTSLTVGEGYMIKTSKAQVFRYPPYANLANQTASIPELPTFVNGIQTNAISTLTAAITTEAPAPAVPSSSLKLDQHLLNYAENMNIVASIPSDYTKVEFYNAQTNQIIGQAQTVKVGDQNLIFGTIYGDTTVGIKAKLISDNQSAFATNSIYFKANDVLGSLATPIQLTASEKVVLELNAYPNPFMNDLTIEFTSDIDGIASLEIYNDQTRLIESKQITVSKGLNKYKYHSSKAAIGNYLVFKLEVGNRLYTKLILKH